MHKTNTTNHRRITVIWQKCGYHHPQGIRVIVSTTKHTDGTDREGSATVIGLLCHVPQYGNT
eukprot:14190668-Ditylum_brightwellii.AAC.1